MEDPNHFNMQTDDQNSSMNQLWDNNYVIPPLPDDQMITPSHDWYPFPEDQMINSVDQPSYDDLIPFLDQSTSMNQLAYDSNPSSSTFSFDADLEDVFNFIFADEYLENIPLGYLFLPTDGELVVGYLKKLVNKEPLPPNKICNVNVYDHSPEELAGISGQSDDHEWYFFSPYKRKSKGGTRAERTTPNGYWKASSGDKPVTYNGEHVGYQKTLVYYEGKSTSAKKTQWIMHEYRLTDSPQQNDDDMVVCRIHNHVRGNRSNNAAA